jgi:hypothetical protein
MKLMAPAIEEIPAKCKAKIPASTAAPECERTPLSGGYSVHPEPTPDSMKADNKSKNRAGGKSQKEILFIRGNAISGAPIIIGTNQLPNAPIIMGITIKNIITNA